MNVVLTQPVEISLRTLGGENHRHALAWLGRLKHWGDDSSVRERAHKLALPEDIYVFHTDTDLRIFFSLEADRIVVLDMAKKATIVKSGGLAGQDQLS